MQRKKFLKLLGYGAIGVGVAPVAFAKNVRKKSNEAICKLTWDNLCGKIGKVYKTNAFEYVHPKKRLPNVFIYGDSVSIAYSSTVMKLLREEVNVFRLFKNGGSSNQFVPNMDKLQTSMFQPNLEEGWKFKWDVIHFNVGLHDLKYLKGKNLNKKGKQVSSIATYKENLDNICKYLKENHPKATLIFATTTPVPKGAKGRFAGDSAKYNKAALELLSINHPDILINDLYSYTKPHLESWAQEPGNVHYNEVGYRNQGKKVAQVIREAL